MRGHFGPNGFVPNFDAMKKMASLDDDDEGDGEPRRRKRPAARARRASVGLADVVAAASGSSGGGGAPATPKSAAAKPSTDSPLIVKALAALKNPAALPKWAKIGAVVIGGVAVVGGLAYFEERHYAKLRAAADGDDDGDDKGKPGAPKWRKVG